LVVCVAAFVIEVGRALGGNSLSWAYVFEWPIFAVFAVYMWWHLLHDRDGARPKELRDSPGDGSTPSPGPGATPDDADLLAWQEYLRGMEAEEARQTEEHGPDAG
jgi:hypothetical protein